MVIFPGVGLILNVLAFDGVFTLDGFVLEHEVVGVENVGIELADQILIFEEIIVFEEIDHLRIEKRLTAALRRAYWSSG